MYLSIKNINAGSIIETAEVIPAKTSATKKEIAMIWPRIPQLEKITGNEINTKPGPALLSAPASNKNENTPDVAHYKEQELLQISNSNLKKQVQVLRKAIEEEKQKQHHEHEVAIKLENEELYETSDNSTTMQSNKKLDHFEKKLSFEGHYLCLGKSTEFDEVNTKWK